MAKSSIADVKKAARARAQAATQLSKASAAYQQAFQAFRSAVESMEAICERAERRELYHASELNLSFAWDPRD